METTIADQIKGCGFEPVTEKGKGTYGVVWGIVDTDYGTMAYKYVRPYDYQMAGLDDLNEIDITRRIMHPHVAHAYKFVTPDDCKIDGTALILPDGDQGTLVNVALNAIPNVTFNHKLQILYQLATGLEFLHQNNILHLDIKMPNVILQGESLHPYLIDFGFSIVVDDVATGFQSRNKYVTINYRPPELLTGSDKRRYNGAVDVWSFGIMMLYVLTGKEYHNIKILSKDDQRAERMLADHLRTFDHPKTYDSLMTSIPQEYVEICKDFFLQVLNTDPDERLTASQMVKHPLFDSVRTQVIGEVIEPRIVGAYPKNHSDIITTLVVLTDDLYSNYPAKLLFLAIDLYNRVIPTYDNPKLIQQYIMAGVCLWCATKLTRFGIFETDEFVSVLNAPIATVKARTSISIDDFLAAEIDLLRRLDGILYISKLYRACRNRLDLAVSLKYIIGYDDKDGAYNPTTYRDVDLPAWIESIDKSKWGIQPKSNKRLSVSKLISLVQKVSYQG